MRHCAVMLFVVSLAAAFGTASLQNGWISRFYHPSGCGS
jgi:hypothetical protein